MPNVVNYAERFESQIEEQYKTELTSADFAENSNYKFINAQTIKIGSLTLSGYKDHSRDGSKNRGKVENSWIPYKLTHDRDVEFYVDDMDVDETNMILSAANVTATFNTDQAIPETDSYRYSKLLADYTALGKTANSTALTVANFLELFDKMMEEMDEAGVPSEGRKMKVTPSMNTIIKNAQGIQRTLELGGTAPKGFNRSIHSLDEVEIKVVPSSRLKTAYDFTEGCTPAASAKQINFILYHNSAIIAPVKVKDIYLWPKGTTPESAYGFLYQNRSYQDCFIITKKVDGIKFHVEA